MSLSTVAELSTTTLIYDTNEQIAISEVDDALVFVERSMPLLALPQQKQIQLPQQPQQQVMSSGNRNSHNAPPPQRQLSGERSINTSVRLQYQGFVSNKSKFAMKSICWGGDEWNTLLRPFVSDLVFRSLESRRFQSVGRFRPYTCHAVVLFVDISNYSKITSGMAYLGSHTISTVVNEYLSRLLHIVTQYGGDVVKFAGDAVLIVWEGSKEDIENNLLLASKCVLEMQEKAGTHVIDAKKSLYFRIHCGLCTGLLESDIFVAPNHINMQKYFHSVSGESLIEISHLVDVAKAGEICISKACAEILGNRGTYQNIDRDGCKLLKKVYIDEATSQEMGFYLKQILSDRLVRRSKSIEEDFIHPSVLRLLVHSGLSPTQIAQMRNLCVLFIAMTSKGSSMTWLIEVQTILEKHRCPSTFTVGLYIRCYILLSYVVHILIFFSRCQLFK